MRALVAEGYWADTVRTPTPWTLLKWLLAVVPFVVPRVLDGGLRRNSERMDRLRRSRAPHRLAGFAGLALWRLAQNVFVVGVTLALLAGALRDLAARGRRARSMTGWRGLSGCARSSPAAWRSPADSVVGARRRQDRHEPRAWA